MKRARLELVSLSFTAQDCQILEIGLSCNTAIDDDSEEEEEDDALETLSREQKIKVISTPFEVSRRVSAEI